MFHERMAGTDFPRATGVDSSGKSDSSMMLNKGVEPCTWKGEGEHAYLAAGELLM
jgi:hypothetical protein